MTLNRSLKLTHTVRVRFTANTKRQLIRAAKAYKAKTVSDFVRDLVEVTLSGDVERVGEFARRALGATGEQLILQLPAPPPKKGRR